MTDRKLKIFFGLISLVLLITIIACLRDAPGGIILSGLFLGLIVLAGIVIGCAMAAAILSALTRKYSFFTIFFFATTISFATFQYQLYSPTLIIIVPDGYRGRVHLVLSSQSENILAVDSNGIGYLNKWTFNHTYSRPVVEQANGMNLDEYLIGFNMPSFFGNEIACCVEEHEVRSLSFKIGSEPHLKDEYFETKDLSELVDESRTELTELDKQ